MASGCLGRTTILWAFNPEIEVSEETKEFSPDQGPIATTTVSAAITSPSTTTPVTLFPASFTSCTFPITSDTPYFSTAFAKMAWVKSCGWTCAIVFGLPMGFALPDTGPSTHAGTEAFACPLLRYPGAPLASSIPRASIVQWLGILKAGKWTHFSVHGWD